MILKKLHAADLLFSNFNGYSFDVVRFVDVFLVCVAQVSHLRIMHIRPNKIEITINHRHVFVFYVKKSMIKVRSSIARLANLSYERFGLEFRPYQNSFEITLPIEAKPQLGRTYLITFENTSAGQWIEFKRIPCDFTKRNDERL